MAGNFKRHKNKGYVSINRTIFYEKDISLKAKGLYALVMALPEDWDFSLKGICAISKENYTAINNAVKELMDAGFCQREIIKEKGRFVGCDYHFYEVKQDSPCLGFLNAEKPNMENLKENNINSSINSPINEIKNIPTTPTPTRMSDDELNREQGLLLGNSQWIEVICMKHKITLDMFRDMVADFILDCRCNAQNRHQDEQDLRSHFNNWLRIKLQSNGNNRPNINAGYRKPSPEDNIRTVEQWALEQTRKCLSGEADRERERLSEGLPF